MDLSGRKNLTAEIAEDAEGKPWFVIRDSDVACIAGYSLPVTRYFFFSSIRNPKSHIRNPRYSSLIPFFVAGRSGVAYTGCRGSSCDQTNC